MKEVLKVSGVAEEALRHAIENEGYKVYKETYEQLAEDLKRGTPNSAHYEVHRALKAYADTAIDELGNLVNSTLPGSVNQTYINVVEETVAKAVTGMVSSEKAISDTVMKWQKMGFYGFTDKGGKRWKADTYARTIVKSTTYRVYREMREKPAEVLGVDTFYYSMKATPREMCAPLQHQIVTKGVARVEKGVKVYALSDYGYGTHAGCLGTNCGHMMTPFVIGVNDKPDLPDYLKDMTPEQAIENANKQAKQRMLERRIRDNKEKLHVARELGDKALIDTLKLKGKTLDMAMNSFLKDNEFLHRQKKREQLWRNEASIKATTNKLRESTRKTEEQYKKYRDIIGENNMPSMDKFKQMKYNNTIEYKDFTRNVRYIETLKNAILNNKLTNRHSITIYGLPNSTIDRLGRNGQIIQRRYFDKYGKPMLDIDYTDHDNPKMHPLVPHAHDWTDMTRSGIKRKRLKESRELNRWEKIAEGIEDNE